MKDLISHIITKAKKKGACDLINLSSSLKDLYLLQCSPQGREFCQKKNFPGYDLWKLIKRHSEVKDYNIFIDDGDIKLSGVYDSTFIGKTQAQIDCDGLIQRYTIKVQHGATVKITAHDYAVVVISNIGANNKISINKDKTARILWEGISG